MIEGVFVCDDKRSKLLLNVYLKKHGQYIFTRERN